MRFGFENVCWSLHQNNASCEMYLSENTCFVINKNDQVWDTFSLVLQKRYLPLNALER